MERLRSLLLSLASRLAFVAAVLAVPGFVAFVLANGVVPGLVLPALLTGEAVWLAVVLRRRPLHRRGAWGALVGAVLIAAGAMVRLTASRESNVLVCRPDCDARGAWWLRLFDEHETVQAGLLLSRALGATDARELAEFREVFRRAYASTPSAGPNALLLSSRPASVAALRYEPPGTAPLPTIVFLHGFGGLLTPYVEAMGKGLHDRFLVVAPVLDPVGAWLGGDAVLEVYVELAKKVDREWAPLAIDGLAPLAVKVLEVLSEKKYLAGQVAAALARRH